VQELVAESRDKILLEDHLDGIGKRLKQAENAKLPDIGPVGPDPVLDDSALFPLQPGKV